MAGCRFALVFLAVLFVFTVCRGGFCAADTTSDEASIASGANAFRKSGDFNWYDASSDAARPLTIRPPQAPSVAKNPSSTGGNSSSAADHSMFLLFLIIAFVLIGLGIWAILYRLDNDLNQSTSAPRVAEVETMRIENLPMPVNRKVVSLFEESESLYRQGRYSEAIVYLYGHMLVESDRRHLIQLDRGKTNRQYVRESKRLPAAGTILEHTMIAFEEVFFGKHELSQSRFEECRSDHERFQKMLVSFTTEAAA